MFETILVAIDHSDHSQRALSVAKELAQCSGGKIRIVHVREVLIGKAGHVPKELADEADELVDDSVKAATKEGIDATGAVFVSHSGHVASVILQEAADSSASVIVMGSRGRTDLEGLVMGSTTHKVLHLGTLPVLVAR